MSNQVRSDIPLSENVGTFKVRECLLQTVIGESAFGALHLRLKGGFQSWMH